MRHNENGLGILSSQGKQVYKLTKERRHGKLVRDPATRECRRVSALRHMAVGLGVGRGVRSEQRQVGTAQVGRDSLFSGMLFGEQ